jgi:hypothetical protein
VSGSAAERVAASLESIRPFVLQICEPLKALWNDLNQEIVTESLQVELGLSFAAEGNLYFTRASSNANLRLTISFVRAGAETRIQ